MAKLFRQLGIGVKKSASTPDTSLHKSFETEKLHDTQDEERHSQQSNVHNMVNVQKSKSYFRRTRTTTSSSCSGGTDVVDEDEIVFISNVNHTLNSDVAERRLYTKLRNDVQTDESTDTLNSSSRALDSVVSIGIWAGNAIDPGGGGGSEVRAPLTTSSSVDATTWEAQEKRLLQENCCSFPAGAIDFNQVLLYQDYSEPADFHKEPPESPCSVRAVSETQWQDDDYSEPFITKDDETVHPETCTVVEEGLSNDGQETSKAITPGDVTVVSDDRPSEDYDKPWEWRPSGKLSHALISGEKTDTNYLPGTQEVHEVASSDEGDTTMTRQRHIYETAFDSTVKHDTDLGEFEEITNHPILRDESPLVTPKTTPKTPVRTLTSRDVANTGFFTPKEKRKVTLTRDGVRRNQNEPITLLSYDKVKDSSTGVRTEQVKAIVHAPPRSANSTPLLSRNFRYIDSAASSARSTPTHYSSTAKVDVQVPLKPLSDQSLNSPANPIPPGFQLLPSLFSRLSLSSTTGPASSSSTGPASTSTSGSASTSSESVLPEPLVKSCESDASETKADDRPSSQGSSASDHKEGDEDTRPSDDYDPPWEFVRKKRPLPFSFSLDSAQLLSVTSNPAPSDNVDDNETKKPNSNIEQPNRPRPRLSLTLPLTPLNISATDTAGSNRTNLSLSFGDQCSKRKQTFQLNFGCAALSVVGEKVDPTIPLERQGWYHGSISRIDAENVLRVLKEGSYLVRNSESNKQDYSLSLKSARGFMHMKIVNADGSYILGKFSKPFCSIPDMIHHYSINKLPIKGAEHMSLLYPVIDQLL